MYKSIKHIKQYICHCLPPDRTWHKVNEMKVDYSGVLEEGKVGQEPKLKPWWAMMQLAHPKVAKAYKTNSRFLA